MPQSPAFLITVLVLNLTTDICIILIPIPIILPLKISWGRKVGLMILFCAGIFIMIAAILRVYFVLAVSTPSLDFYGPLLIYMKASKGRNSRHLVMSRRCRRSHYWSGYHDPSPLYPPILERQSDEHLWILVEQTLKWI